MENHSEKAHLQLCEKLRQRIRSGEYPAGKRIAGVRTLAADFNASPVTILKAFDILEAEHLIERIPMKGVYVLPPRETKRPLLVMLPFPEKDLSPEKQGWENYGMSYEFQQGMLSAAAECNAVLQFCYCEDHIPPEKCREQAEKLKKADLVIFVGEQLMELQNEIASFCRTVRLAGHHNIQDSRITICDYDYTDAREQLAEHIVNCGCKTAGLIGFWENPEYAADSKKLFYNACKKYGILCQNDLLWHQQKNISAIAEILTSPGRPDFLFCINANTVALICEAAKLAGLKIGKDFQMASIASGVTFTNIYPDYTYFKVPRFEMGSAVIKHAAEAVRKGQTLSSAELQHFKVSPIQGKSTILKNNQSGE